MNPFLIHTFEHQFERIKTMTRQELFTLHIVERGGMFKCLNLDIAANSLLLLYNLIEDALNQLSIDAILPYSSETEWREIWGNKMKWLRITPGINHPSGKHLQATLTQL